MVGGRRIAIGAAGFRRRARRRFAALHADDDRLRRGQHPDGAARRPLRHRRAGSRRNDRARAGLRGGCPFADSRAVRASRTACSSAFGSSATFAPLLAHTSLWFDRRRGLAIGIFASGNYLAGTVWPPIVQHFIETAGWRATYYGIAAFVLADHAPARAGAAPSAARPRRHASGRQARRARDAGSARAVAALAADAARDRRRVVLRGDVDAAGAHRRVLQRPGLRSRRAARRCFR